MEHFSYGLISASCDLVDVFGKAPGFHLTNWTKQMPMDRWNSNAAKLTTRKLSCDWDSLQKRVAIKGMANCGLAMIPPSESSSIGSNQTSSLEPIREQLTIKDRQGFNLKQYAPDPIILADKYDYAYDTKDMTQRFLKHVAISNKWIDKQISNNAFYNPENYPDEKVDLMDIISDMFYAKFLGVGTMYYLNTRIKDPSQQQEQAGCSGSGCSV